MPPLARHMPHTEEQNYHFLIYLCSYSVKVVNARKKSYVIILYFDYITLISDSEKCAGNIYENDV